MHVDYEDREYTFDLDEIDLNQARIIKDKCGLTLFGLEAGLSEGDPDALRAIFWLMLSQSGEKQDIDRVNFKIVKFAQALDKASREEAEAAEAAAKADKAPKGRAVKASSQA